MESPWSVCLAPFLWGQCLLPRSLVSVTLADGCPSCNGGDRVVSLIPPKVLCVNCPPGREGDRCEKCKLFYGPPGDCSQVLVDPSGELNKIGALSFSVPFCPLPYAREDSCSLCSAGDCVQNVRWPHRPGEREHQQFVVSSSPRRGAFC